MSDKIKRFASVNYRKKAPVSKRSSLQFTNISRHNSIIGLEELIQCGICMEELVNPRMLDCQHTFCLTCLQNLFIEKSTLLATSPSGKLDTAKQKIDVIDCPTCFNQTPLPDGNYSLEKLKSNVYIDSLLKLVKGQNSPQLTQELRCVKCQTVSSNNSHQICQHCSQIFCNICWQGHIVELNDILTNLNQQLDETERKLEHKTRYFTDHCEQIRETVRKAIEDKVAHLLKTQKKLSEELNLYKADSKRAAESLKTRVAELKLKIKEEINDVRNDKVQVFMTLHKDGSELLNEIYTFGESKVIFDSDRCKLDLCDEGIYNDEDEAEILQSLDPAVEHYKTRTFLPTLKWSKCPRPAGVAVSPWDSSNIYIASTDSKSIRILDRNRQKLVGKITHENFVCPTALAFSSSRNELYVSDKWQDCIHVFSKNKEYMRMICHGVIKTPDGVSVGPNDELVISDTGNNRVVIVHPTDGSIISEISGLNYPTGLTTYGDNIIVADTGNHRIKIFNMQGKLLQEFGSLGKNPGQFRYAEAVAVDPLGFILVGDGGNARIQVFKPDGTIIKIFGRKQNFGWVSGLAITPDLSIIMTDHKNKNCIIF